MLCPTVEELLSLLLSIFLVSKRGSLSQLVLSCHSLSRTIQIGRTTTLVESVSGANAVIIVDTYDAAGRKTKQVRNTTTTTYTYDNADRLTGQRVTGARATFVMDAVGNITVKSQEGASPQTITRSSVARPLTRSGNIHSAWPCP